MKKILLISGLALLLTVGAVKAITLNIDEFKSLFGSDGQPVFQTLSGLGGAPLDVVGTRIGSSTTAVGFYGANTATTTYSTYIGQDIDKATYDIYIKAASSSANAFFSLLTSPDDFCNATSSTYYSGVNNYLTTQVQWFDAGDHLSNKAHSTSLSAGTSTLAFLNPTTGTNRQIILENLNSQCLGLQINSSSTELQVQLSTKQ